MKKFLIILFLVLSICFLNSCSNPTVEPPSSGSETNNTPTGNTPGTSTPATNTPSTNTPTGNTSSSDTVKISSEYWGTWIQMDTGTEFYIDSQNIYKYSSPTYKTKVQAGISGYSLESDEVLKKGNTVFFRKGGKKRSFSATISGFSSSSSNSIRAAENNSLEITGKRTNKINQDDTETVKSTIINSLDFDGGVADDPQEVTIIDGDCNGTVTVTPAYDGENIGSIPVIEPGKYAFKTTYTISNADEQGFMFGNNLGLYTITFNITNIGQETCSTSLYSISWDDTNLTSTDLVREGNFTSIAPGAAKSITGSFSYLYFNEEYKDVTVRISVTDSKYSKTWNDFVTLRFYRGLVNYKINARNFNQSSNASLKGFLIYPDGRSKRFTVSANTTFTLSIPWSTKDYYLVFSGANNDTEMCYSFIPSDKGSPADLSGVWSISEINAYEPNDSIQNAVDITDNTQAIKAYLQDGDIDYFKINTSSLNCSKGVIEYSKAKFSDAKSISTSYNNNDGKFNPGETIWMDILLHNSANLTIKNVELSASSTSTYITFEKSGGSYGNIAAGNYQSFYNNYCGFSSKDSIDSVYVNFNYSDTVPLIFTINQNCPVNTTIPVTLTITDSIGNEWTELLNIPVIKTGADLECAEIKSYDAKSISTSYNNNDGIVNPGETIWMDFILHNKGTSQAKQLTLSASSTSPYISFAKTGGSYGDIDAGYYQSFYNNYCSYSSKNSIDSVYVNFNNPNYAPLIFTINQNCPVNTIIPVSLTITDSIGNEKILILNIPVIKTGADLECADFRISDRCNISSNYNNNDGKFNPGETIWMELILHNKGTSQAKQITLSASSTSPYISFSKSGGSYGDIDAGYYQSFYNNYCSYSSKNSINSVYVSFNDSNYAPLIFTIAPVNPENNTPIPTPISIPITLTMTDSVGNEWTDSFNITIE